MIIQFRTKKLAKIVNTHKKLVKTYGDIGAKKIGQRLGDIRDAESLEDLRYAPGRYHELKEDRKGQWACDVQHPYRIIFKPIQDPIPTNEDGQYLWIKIIAIEIIEITDYH